MAEKLPKVCIFGSTHAELFSSPSCPPYETRALDCRGYDTDSGLAAILATEHPSVIITIGAVTQFPNLSHSPADVRRRWIHFDSASDLDRMGAAAFYCFIDNCVRERTDLSPLVSVFTPAYRSGAVIARPHASLEQQTYGNWEWIIVDDSDDDGETFRMLSEMARKDHRILAFKAHAHSGVIGKVKRWACRLANGQILVELDHDDELTPNALSDIVAAFAHYDGSSPERPRAGFVYTDFAEIFPDGSPFTYGGDWGLGYGSYRWESWRGHVYAVANSPNINPKTIRHIVCAPNHARAWRRDCYEEIGGHGRHIHVVDDYELMVRTFLATRMVRVPRLAYLQWRNPSGSISQGNTHRERNKEIQRLTRAFSQHYAQAIHARFVELGIDDYVHADGEDSFQRARSLPKPEVEQHCTLLFEPPGSPLSRPALAPEPSSPAVPAYRFDLINLLIEHNHYERYLEIGVEGGDAVRSVRCALKHGVDPASDHATFRVPSDEFFASIGPDTQYDCIFVDGLHEEEQVLRDIDNALCHLSPGGTILVHDCNPPTAWHQRDYEEAKLNGCRQWNGTVWRAWVRLRATRPDLKMVMVDTDWGCGVIQRGQQQCIELPAAFTYGDFAEHRAEWLNSISPSEFQAAFTKPSRVPTADSESPGTADSVAAE
jgi:hypothetical protein